MRDTSLFIELLDEVEFFDSNQFEEIDENWNTEDSIEILRSRNEVPPTYLITLKEITDESKRKEIFLKFNKIYLYAKSKTQSPTNLKKWLSNGQIPEAASDGISSMTVLRSISEKINKAKLALIKESEKIEELVQKLEEKSSPKTVASCERAEERKEKKARELELLYEDFFQSLERIESTLGSGKKQ